ncbi:coiled-coil domain-containing protein 73 [Stigmatopora nigra]
MDSGLLPLSTIADEAVTPEERSLISTPHQPEKPRPTILLHLLEFKTHLLEAVEELHIRRDAETQYENQISKVVLEKQEIEWKKESLQNQMITAAKHHAESLINVEKQCQIKIRQREEEKGKFQVISELKEKEISNLKEELKSLQLLKYNFEKKANELEQKQTLQSRSKDSHLIQIGEIEKRFAALARQCSTLKKSHTQLEENVDEVMKRNMKLTATNEKHEATIQCLMKEVEEVNTKLIQTKLSMVQQDNSNGIMNQTKQHLNQLSYKLSMEKEMNNKLREENVAKSSEKQEVINVLQYTQQLFLNQVHAVNRLELQLQTQEGQYKALEQEHEEMREKTKLMKEKIIHLMRVQQDFQALKEVHDDLQQKHNELCAQVKVQAHTINELEIFPSLATESRGRPPDEPKSSSMLSFFGSLQNSAVSQNRILDCLEDTSAKTKLDGEMGGQGPLKLDEIFETQLQVQCERAFSIQSPKNLLAVSERIDSYRALLNADRSMSNQVPNVTSSISHQPATNDMGITESSPDRINQPNTDLLSNDLQTNKRRLKDGSTNQNEADGIAKDNVKNTSEKIDEGSTNENQSRKTDDNLEEICVEERDRILISQTANCGNIQETSSLGAHKPKQEKTAEFRYGENQGAKTVTEMESQATCSIKSNTSTDIDAIDATVISLEIGTVCKLEEICVEERDEILIFETANSGNIQEKSSLGAHKPKQEKTAEFRYGENEGGKTGTEMECQATCSIKSNTSTDIDTTVISLEIGTVCKLEEISVEEWDEILISKAANSRNIQEKSSLGAHKPKQGKTAEFRYRENQGGKTGTEMEAQATCSIRSNTPPDIDTTVISLEIGTVCEADCYQNLTEKVADNSLVNIKEGQILKDLNCAVDQNLNSGDISLAQDAQDSCKSEVQTNAERVKSSPTGDHSVIEKTKQVGVDESISTLHTTFSELLSESPDLVTNQTMAEYTNFEEVKKTIVDPVIETPDEGIQEESKAVTTILESDASQREPVTFDEDLIISNTDNGEASKKIESDLSGSFQSNNGHVETLDVGTISLQQAVIKETLCDAVKLPTLPALKTHQPSFDWHASKQTVLSIGTPDSILQSNVQKFPVSEQNACNALCSTQQSKEPLMIIRASDLLKASNASASAGFGRKHKMTGWNVFGKNFRDTAATDKGRASLSASTWPVSSTWSTPSGTSVPTVPPKPDVDLKSRGSQEEHSSIRAQLSKIEQFLETESVHQFKRRRTQN